MRWVRNDCKLETNWNVNPQHDLKLLCPSDDTKLTFLSPGHDCTETDSVRDDVKLLRDHDRMGGGWDESEMNVN